MRRLVFRSIRWLKQNGCVLCRSRPFVRDQMLPDAKTLPASAQTPLAAFFSDHPYYSARKYHQLSEQRDLRQSRCYCPYCCHEPAGTGHGGCQIVILRHNRDQRSLSAHSKYTLLLTRCASCPCDLPFFFYLLPEICTQKRTVISHGAFLIRRYQNLVVFRRMEGPMVVLM